MFHIMNKTALTNRLSEATESLACPQTEAWGFDTMTALRAEKLSQKWHRLLNTLFTNSQKMLTKVLYFLGMCKFFINFADELIP